MAVGLIGGSGFTYLNAMIKCHRREIVRTPYGEPSAPLVNGYIGPTEVWFLPRHGAGHRIPPHRVNYRANIWALHEIGIEQVIGLGTVGGIQHAPQTLLIPDQLIDYTYDRLNTFFDGFNGWISHIDFTQPFCSELRAHLIAAAQVTGLDPVIHSTYGVTQGPRLETSAEIDRLERDGCDIVGMTLMPEAALAKEVKLCYATLAIVVNWAAGRGEDTITQESIDQNIRAGIKQFERLLANL